MSIDEMLAALRAIENSLGKQAPSRGSIEVLGKLAAYYGHQQDQLEGFEKDPRKLQENLKTIDGWITDINLFMKS